MPQVKLQKICAEPEVKLLYLCLPVHPSLSISPLLSSLFVLPPILSFAPPFFPPLSFLPYTLSFPPFPLLFSSPSFFLLSLHPYLFFPPLSFPLTPSSPLTLPLPLPPSHPHRKVAAGSVSVVPCGVSLVWADGLQPDKTNSSQRHGWDRLLLARCVEPSSVFSMYWRYKEWN